MINFRFCLKFCDDKGLKIIKDIRMVDHYGTSCHCFEYMFGRLELLIT